MAHNLMTRSGSTEKAMFYVRKDGVPWHKLGRAVEGALTAKEAIVEAGLDFEIDKSDVFTGGTIIEGYKAVNRVDKDGKRTVLSIMGEDYFAESPREAFAFFDGVVASGDAKFTTAGAIGKGERIWIQAEVSKCEIRIEGTDDLTKPFLLLVDSYNGANSRRMLFSPVRVVCENTVNAALRQGAGTGVSIRHTKNAAEAIMEARRNLGIALKYFDSFRTLSNGLAKKQVNAAGLKTFLETLVPTPKGKDGADKTKGTRIEGVRGQITQLFEKGRGNDAPKIKGSYWALYNGVTEFVDYYRGTRGENDAARESNRLESVWFGSGARMKEEAFDLALVGAGLHK
jgi:phage/plasmid-like protein (TIGR03299 family)